MKTFIELFDEIIKSDELKKAYEDAVKNDAVEAFLKENGCDASLEDVANFFKEQEKASQMTEADMSAIAGGFDDDPFCLDSRLLPWQCNPKYSSIITEDGKIDFSKLCA